MPNVCMQDSVMMKIILPCMCEWCWGERRCPVDNGGLSVLNCQLRHWQRCEHGWKGLSDAGHMAWMVQYNCYCIWKKWSMPFLNITQLFIEKVLMWSVFLLRFFIVSAAVCYWCCAVPVQLWTAALSEMSLGLQCWWGAGVCSCSMATEGMPDGHWLWVCGRRQIHFSKGNIIDLHLPLTENTVGTVKIHSLSVKVKVKVRILLFPTSRYFF